jgi:hypothetical protein
VARKNRTFIAEKTHVSGIYILSLVVDSSSRRGETAFLHSIAADLIYWLIPPNDSSVVLTSLCIII